jgi:CHAD domain-containing protein
VLRQLTRAFGSGRDLDVHVGLLADRLAAVEASSREQRLLLGRLRGARARGRRQLAEAVLDLDIDGLRRNLRRLLRQGAAESVSVRARAAACRDAEASALLGGFSHAGDRYLPDALHALRRRIRRLRYTAELEDAILGADRRAPALWKRLQDAIGTLHDHHVLAAWLEGQARAAATRGQTALSRAARRERSFFLAESRRLHTALVASHPADLALRALDAMKRVGGV